jgi:hypothetical protein
MCGLADVTVAQTVTLKVHHFYTLPAAELKRLEAAAASVTEEWIKDMTSKGLDGKPLYEEAKAGSK